MKNIGKSLKTYKFVLFILPIPVTLLLQLICKSNPQSTESVYSRVVYPALASVISPIFGILPFSAAETIPAALIILLLIAIIKGIIRFFKMAPTVLLRQGRAPRQFIAQGALFCMPPNGRTAVSLQLRRQSAQTV